MPRVRRLLALAVLAVLAAAPAVRAGTMTLKFPRFTVAPHSDREVCYFVRVPRRKAFDSSGFSITNLGVNDQFVSHHFLMYAYTGKEMDSFPTKKIVDSKACLDFGPADRNSRTLIGGSQRRTFVGRLPKGLAQRISPPGDGAPIGIILNSHWINSSGSPQNAAVRVKIFPAQARLIKRYMKPIFEVTANGFIDVPPGGIKDSGWSWSPGGRDFGGAAIGGVSLPTGNACVASITSHMHKRGRSFNVYYVDSHNQREPILSTTDYADAPLIAFDGKKGNRAPILVKVGEKLEYTCRHANGADGVSQRLGCEEDPGVPPGHSITEMLFNPALKGRGLFGAAKDCMTDADCCPAGGPCTDANFRNRSFTGKCVPAKIVFGFTSDDEMCILPGSYYDPNPNVPEAEACDLDLMPLLGKK